MQVMDLTKIANGALVEKAQAAIEQVVQNMTDVNTPYKTKRSVTIKMTFAQDEERETMQSIKQYLEEQLKDIDFVTVIA